MTANEQAVRTYLLARETGDRHLAESLLTLDFGHEMNGRPQSRAELLEEIEAMGGAFSSAHYEILALVEQGDRVACHYRFSALHTGALPIGRERVAVPSGDEVHFDGSFVAELREGRLAQGWGAYDSLGLMRQLGVL
ncbi:MAG: ester cyclase [Acidimicrobiia bacterium]|jgi:predicted ester cyclase